MKITRNRLCRDLPIGVIMDNQEPVTGDKGRSAALSRRNFMRTVGTATAAVAAVAPSPIRAAVTGAKPQYAMVIDDRRCTGCQACTVACKSEYDVPLGGSRSWVESVEKGTYPNVTRSFLPALCNQCSEPPCVPVCPVDATYKRKEDGIVVIDQDECIGCRLCVEACPYDARFMNLAAGDPKLNRRRGAAEKCDFCLHRVTEGVVPSCVNTCTGQARIFGDLNDPDSEVSKLLADNAVTVLKPEEGTKPNVFYIAADHSEQIEAAYSGRYLRIDTNRLEEGWVGKPTHRRAGEGRR